MQRTITQALDKAQDLGVSVRRVAATAAAVLDPQLSATLSEGETFTGLEMVQISLVRWIENDERDLKDFEMQLRKAERELSQLRLERSSQQQDVYEKIIKIRLTFEEAFGRGLALIYLGLGPGLADLKPAELQRHAEEAEAILADPGFQAPEPKVRGIWESPASYSEQIGTSLVPFKAALASIAAKEMEIETLQRKKTEFLKRLNRRLTWTLRWIEAIYRLADLDYHADRLRTTIPTSSGPVTDKEPDTGEDHTGEETETESAV